MKRLVIVFLLLLVLPICFGKDVEVRGVSGDGSITGGSTYYATLEDNVIASVNEETVVYFHRDRLGSNTMVTNGETVRSKTLPFGKELETPDFRYTFTEKELDNSGLYYYGARYYDSDLGRFISADPIFEERTYAYVENNPLKYIDPTGQYFDEAGVEHEGEAQITFDGSRQFDTREGALDWYFSPLRSSRKILFSGTVIEMDFNFDDSGSRMDEINEMMGIGPLNQNKGSDVPEILKQAVKATKKMASYYGEDGAGPSNEEFLAVVAGGLTNLAIEGLGVTDFAEERVGAPLARLLGLEGSKFKFTGSELVVDDKYHIRLKFKAREEGVEAKFSISVSGF